MFQVRYDRERLFREHVNSTESAAPEVGDETVVEIIMFSS